MLPLLLMSLSLAASFVLLWTVGVSRAQFRGEREEGRREAAEATVLTTAVVEAGTAFDEQMAQTTMAGQQDLIAADVALALQTKVRARLTALNLDTRYPWFPFEPDSISITYTTPEVYVSSPEIDAYKDAFLLKMTAAPFPLSAAPAAVSESSRYLDFVPAGHPLVGYAVRRYPFTVRLSYQDRGVARWRERRISVYQMPLAQFARFSATAINTGGNTNVTFAANADVLALGSISGLAPGVRKVIAAQIDKPMPGSSMDMGSEEDRFFNRGSVQTGASRLGGRLSGENWTLQPPHFFTARQGGEKIVATGRPVLGPNDPIPKAYDAQTFLELIYHPAQVSRADEAAGVVTLNLYDQTGQRHTSRVGRMRGQNVGEPEPWSETILDATGNTIGVRTNRYSASPAFAGSSAVGQIDLIVVEPGSHVFRVANTAGEAVQISLDGAVIANSTNTEFTFSVALAGGLSRLLVRRTGGLGEVALFVTPPSLAEAWVSQWGVQPGTAIANVGSFGTGFIGADVLAWRPLPPGQMNNAGGSGTVALILKLDATWPFTSAGGNSVLYAEGVEEGRPRNFNDGGLTFASVVIELIGDSYSAAMRAHRSVTLISPNPVVFNGLLNPQGYEGFFLISRGVLGPDMNSVFLGYNQAGIATLNVAGVVSGARAEMKSYFDRQTPATAAFAAQAAGENFAPFYKRLVLIDDFYFAEGMGP
jgi:hypothetical protein